jgi:hypothetical protein
LLFGKTRKDDRTAVLGEFQMARYKLSQRIPKHVLLLNDGYYPEYPIDALFPLRFASDEQFAAELEQRLKKIPYPYEPTRAQKAQSQSTFDLMDKLGALPLIAEPSRMLSLRIWANMPAHYSRLRQIRSSSTALGKKFRNFHVPLTKELTRHTAAVRKLKEAYQLGDEWIGSYLKTAEQRLSVEAALLRAYTESYPLSDTRVTRESVCVIYDHLSKALKSKTANHALCCHLTSVICSPNCLATGMLFPSPESVRKLIERDRVKHKRKSGN